MNFFNKFVSLFTRKEGTDTTKEKELFAQKTFSTPENTIVTSSAAKQVTFKNEVRKPHPMVSNIETITKIHSAPNKDAAVDFLREQNISEPYYYVEVITPEGMFGTDNTGDIYDSGGEFYGNMSDYLENSNSTSHEKMTGDQYVDRCFTCNWEEISEPRFWSNEPDLKKIVDLDRGNTNFEKDEEMLQQIEKVWNEYEDHAFVYVWKAIIQSRQGRRTEAIGTLDTGLTKARSKVTICSKRAELEYAAGSISEAFVWWIRSAVTQLSVGEPKINSPFLYLAYVAEAVNDTPSRDKLFKIVDSLTQYGRLNYEAIQKIHSLVLNGPKQSMQNAIKKLCDEFLED